jgi:hypothetical protein
MPPKSPGSPSRNPRSAFSNIEEVIFRSPCNFTVATAVEKGRLSALRTAAAVFFRFTLHCPLD